MAEFKLPKKINIDMAEITKEDWETYQKDLKMIKFLLQEINDTLEGGIWHTNIKEGAITATQLKIGMQNWSHDIVFSSTDSNTVSWTTGTITMANGTTYPIVAANTGNMTARTYIYLDIAISTTVLQITTIAGTATGDGKLLLASAVNSTSKALFQVYGGAGGVYIAGGNIEAGSVTATQLTGTNLSALYADLGTITAGNMTLDSSGFIRSFGKDSYADTTAGFWLGYDTDKYKLNIGDATHYLKWTGSLLDIKGRLTVGGSGTQDEIYFKDSTVYMHDFIDGFGAGYKGVGLKYSAFGFFGVGYKSGGKTQLACKIGEGNQIAVVQTDTGIGTVESAYDGDIVGLQFYPGGATRIFVAYGTGQFRLPCLSSAPTSGNASGQIAASSNGELHFNQSLSWRTVSSTSGW